MLVVVIMGVLVVVCLPPKSCSQQVCQTCEAAVTQTYIILQLTDNEVDSVKLLALEGKQNEKKTFTLRVKAVSGIKCPNRLLTIL